MSLAAFAAFALASQALLLAFFVARRWLPPIAERYGWVAYAFGLVGLALGLALGVNAEPWQLFAGPLLFAAWAAFGAWADLATMVEWRNPIRWRVFAPYVVLYVAAQMFLWWPLWNLWRTGWVVYLVFFVANTALNAAGHVRPKVALSA